MFLLKGLYMDLLRLTSSELQCYGSNSKGTRDIGEGTELPGFGVRAGRVAIPQTEVLEQAIFPLLSSSPAYTASASTIANSPSTWLTLFALFWKFLRPPSPT